MVALRKESVDRNVDGAVSGSGDYVALRKESVDRNVRIMSALNGLKIVALRKESVDRNAASGCAPSANGGSLSARRAWIEMRGAAMPASIARASLSARRAWIEIEAAPPLADGAQRRSPQGERG